MLVFTLIFRGYQNKKEELKKIEYKTLIEEIIFSDGNINFLKELCKKDIVLLEGILFEYLLPLKNSMERDKIIAIAVESGMVNYYMELLTKGNKTEKNIALIRLGSLGIEKAVPFIIELLDSDSINMFLNSSYALIQIKGLDYLPKIITKLDDFKDFDGYPLVEKRIMNIIAQMDEDIFADLEKLFNSNDPQLIVFSMKILSYRKDARIDNYVIKFLQHDDILVRETAKESAVSVGIYKQDSWLGISL
jgi:hypothetical protein